MQAKNNIERNTGWNGFEEGTAFLHGFLPTVVRSFSSFSMDMRFIVIGYFVSKDGVSFGQAGDPIAFTKERDSPL